MIPIRSYWSLLNAYLRRQRVRVAWLALIVFTAMGLQVANPQLIRSFIDRAIGGEDSGSLLPLAVSFIAVAILAQALTVLGTWVAEQVGWRATNDLRNDLFDHLLHLDMDFHKTHTPGELVERVDGDVNSLANFFSQFTIQVVGNVALILGILVLLWWESVVVGAAMTLLAVVALASTLPIQLVASRWWLNVKAIRAEFFGFLGEQVEGTEDVRANGAARYMLRRFTRIMRRWLPAEVKGRMGWSFLWASNIVTFGTSAILVFILGSWLLDEGRLTLGSVYLVFHYTEMMRHPLDRIRTQMEDLQKAEAGIERVRQLFARQHRLPMNGRTILPSGPLSVSMREVDFAYSEDDESGNGQRVLHGVSIDLEPGRVLGVLGRTGSGKTTLARLLTRLYDPERGSISLGGVVMPEADVANLRQRVGMVTQDVQLFRAAVRDNLTFFDRGIDDDQLWEALRNLGIAEWVEGLPAGLDTMLDAGGGGLSAGEAQLLAFTRVFLDDAGLVVLDEASSRLDPATERLVEEAVERLLEGRTGVIIAHRLETVNRADDILILDGGRIVEFGPRTALARDPSSRFSQLLATGLEGVLG